MKHFLLVLIPALAVFTGCKDDHGHHHGHDDHGHSHSDHGHHHDPPHGGAPVVLGDEAFHLEFVNDPETGTLNAYVLDGHMENFVRLTNAALSVSVARGDTNETLELKALANNATGEKVGDTSHFAATAEWLKTATTFDAVIPSIEVRGTTYTNIAFNYPKGNE